MAISASVVKQLRDKTGAGMMDCKNALVKADGDLEKALDELRKSGIAKAEKKSGRTTKEGKILTSIIDGKGAMAEVLCETDFAATNEKFVKFVTDVATRALDIDCDGDVSETVQAAENDALVNMIAIIGENMQIRRIEKWNTNGKIASYLHQGGRIGVMVDVEGECDAEFLNDLCMHIAAFNPEFVSPDAIPAEVIAKEKEIATAQMQGKPAEIIDKIVMGKINKWYKEVCLTKQPWIKDDKSSMDKVAPKATVKRFIRWSIGEEL
ncbi:MAG: translation elongation factor Ts [Victivallaceae bacterium]|nr:translation elongation factor Ts [Victivallaceae bacterium]